ncbi:MULTISPECIES: hypothetical protein [unclassified Gemella]|uniref:hypothetical protein n=1 Tax=unclassified Gemella TaxID=2624949 RepID=UPI001C03FCBB|nr:MULTISPECIES: hypothetical protein [unclassified Gemella]MBU0278998.1 hypothetical protein [Gemella sp. zg-1178]QWQ38738.1 hypothetical protein KMP11_07295 [Gemella sp. zg-570]
MRGHKKFLSAILASSLLVTPISALVNNYNNVAKAEKNEILFNEKVIEEGEIIKDYISFNKKNNIYVFSFYYDKSLDIRLNNIRSNITSKDINEYISKLNDRLIKENGEGLINDSIKEIQYYSKLNGDSLFRSACGNVFAWVGLAHSTFYGLLIGGPVGAGLSAFTGLAYAIGSTVACP